MNEIVRKVLLAGGKFMPEIHLKQLGFTYSASGSFTKNKERIQKFKEKVYTNYIYKSELDKACFQHDMAYGDFKNLAKRTASDKFLRDKAFKIASNPKYDEYEKGLASMVYKLFDKNSAGNGTKNVIKQNQQQLAEELHKLIIRKFLQMKSLFIIQRQYLGCWFSWYAINK